MLFPDIITNKEVFNDDGNVDVLKLVRFCKLPNEMYKELTYDKLYNYLKERKHMYVWWML